MATTKKTPADVATKTVTAKVPVQYDNAAVAVGETFEVRVTDLQQLLDVGAVEVTAQAAGE